MKKLPLGKQNFENIIKQNLLYLDKTKYIFELFKKEHTISDEYSYFLSRPRRFGKSLFIDTMYHLFNGDKELFKGLYIYDKWDWSNKYPIIRIDFSKGNYSSVEEVKNTITSLLLENMERYNIDIDLSKIINFDLNYAIKVLSSKYKQKIIILIDEYDNPILSNLEKDKNILENIRNKFSEFFKAIKANEEYIEFSFITGITKISQVNLFSGNNNVVDISLNSEFGAICGYTQKDIETILKPYLKNVNLERLKLWYNGYYFGGDESNKLYNPYDILLFIKDNFNKPISKIRFKNYWINTGNSQLISKLFSKTIANSLAILENIESKRFLEEELTTFNIENIKTIPLLFQAGYLTIKKIESIEQDEDVYDFYTLSLANKEVQISLNRILINSLNNNSIDLINQTNFNVMKALSLGDLDSFIENIKSIYASIMSGGDKGVLTKEFHYASLFFVYLRGIGYDVKDLIQEDQTNKGRIDLTIHTKDFIYIIEFKTSLNPQDAFKQIVEKKYYEKYTNSEKKVVLLGITFDVNDRNIGSYDLKPLDELLNELKITNEVVIDNSFDEIGGVGV